MRNCIKRALALLLSLTLCFGLLPGLALADDNLWTDYAQEVTPNDEGVYEISTAAELAWLAKGVNDYSISTYIYDENWDMILTVFRLTADIDLSAHLWTPIGGLSNKFCGIFDGAGHTISGLRVGSAETPYTDGYYAGLFGAVQGEIWDLRLRNAAVYAAPPEGGSETYAGLIVGRLWGSGAAVGYCEVNGSVFTAGTTYSNSDYGAAGGIAGDVYRGKVEGCRADVTLFAGAADRSYSLGGIAGIAGVNNTVTLNNCVSTVSISAPEPTGGYQHLDGICCGGSRARLNNCAATVDFGGGEAQYSPNGVRKNVCSFETNVRVYSETTYNYEHTDSRNLYFDGEGGKYVKAESVVKSANFLAALNEAAAELEGAKGWSAGTNGFPTLTKVGVRAYYTVRFVSAGETYTEKTVPDGGAVSAPAQPSREGYTFLWWYGEDPETPYDFSSPVTGPTEITAAWDAHGYTVMFDSRGGSYIYPQGVKQDQPIPEPEPPARRGFRFDAWYTDEDCTQAWNFLDGTRGDMTLYAGWTAAGGVSLTGRITDASTGREVEGASVSLSNGQNALSDDFGFYRIENVAAGTYTVTVTANGYLDETTEGLALENESVGFDAALTPDAGEGGSTLTVYATVSCVYTGLMLRGVSVRATGEDDQGRALGPYTGVTDAKGNVSFTRLPAGKYSFAINETGRPGWESYVSERSEAVLSGHYNLECALKPNYQTLSITVTGYDPVKDQENVPLKGKKLALTALDPENRTKKLCRVNLTTDENGTVVFDHAVPVTWEICCEDASYQTVTDYVYSDAAGHLTRNALALNLPFINSSVTVNLSTLYADRDIFKKTGGGETSSKFSESGGRKELSVQLEGVPGTLTAGIVRETKLDDEGKADFDRLLAGGYNLTVSGNAKRYVAIPARDGKEIYSSTEDSRYGPKYFYVEFYGTGSAAVALGEHTQATVKVKPAYVSFSGTLYKSDMNDDGTVTTVPLPKTKITIRPSAYYQLNGEDAAGYEIETDENGFYSVNLAPGLYGVTVEDTYHDYFGGNLIYHEGATDNCYYDFNVRGWPCVGPWVGTRASAWAWLSSGDQQPYGDIGGMNLSSGTVVADLVLMQKVFRYHLGDSSASSGVGIGQETAAEMHLLTGWEPLSEEAKRSYVGQYGSIEGFHDFHNNYLSVNYHTESRGATVSAHSDTGYSATLDMTGQRFPVAFNALEPGNYEFKYVLGDEFSHLNLSRWELAGTNPKSYEWVDCGNTARKMVSFYDFPAAGLLPDESNPFPEDYTDISNPNDNGHNPWPMQTVLDNDVSVEFDENKAGHTTVDEIYDDDPYNGGYYFHFYSPPSYTYETINMEPRKVYAYHKYYSQETGWYERYEFDHYEYPGQERLQEIKGNSVMYQNFRVERRGSDVTDAQMNCEDLNPSNPDSGPDAQLLWEEPGLETEAPPEEAADTPENQGGSEAETPETETPETETPETETSEAETPETALPEGDGEREETEAMAQLFSDEAGGSDGGEPDSHSITVSYSKYDEANNIDQRESWSNSEDPQLADAYFMYDLVGYSTDRIPGKVFLIRQQRQNYHHRHSWDDEDFTSLPDGNITLYFCLTKNGRNWPCMWNLDEPRNLEMYPEIPTLLEKDFWISVPYKRNDSITCRINFLTGTASGAHIMTEAEVENMMHPRTIEVKAVEYGNAENVMNVPVTIRLDKDSFSSGQSYEDQTCTSTVSSVTVESDEWECRYSSMVNSLLDEDSEPRKETFLVPLTRKLYIFPLEIKDEAGQPVENADVSIVGVSRAAPVNLHSDAAGKAQAGKMTDYTWGTNYVIDGLTYQDYRVKVTARGYSKENITVTAAEIASGETKVITLTRAVQPTFTPDKQKLDKKGAFIPGVRFDGSTSQLEFVTELLDSNRQFWLGVDAELTIPEGDELVELYLIDRRSFAVENSAESEPMEIYPPDNWQNYNPSELWEWLNKVKTGAFGKVYYQVFENKIYSSVNYFEKDESYEGPGKRYAFHGDTPLWELPVGGFSPCLVAVTERGAVQVYTYVYDIREEERLVGVRLEGDMAETLNWLATISNLKALGGEAALRGMETLLQHVPVISTPTGTFVPNVNFTANVEADEDGYLTYTYEVKGELTQGTSITSYASNSYASYMPTATGLIAIGGWTMALDGKNRELDSGYMVEVKGGNLQLKNYAPKALLESKLPISFDFEVMDPPSGLMTKTAKQKFDSNNHVYERHYLVTTAGRVNVWLNLSGFKASQFFAPGVGKVLSLLAEKGALDLGVEARAIAGANFTMDFAPLFTDDFGELFQYEQFGVGVGVRLGFYAKALGESLVANATIGLSGNNTTPKLNDMLTLTATVKEVLGIPVFLPTELQGKVNANAHILVRTWFINGEKDFNFDVASFKYQWGTETQFSLTQIGVTGDMRSRDDFTPSVFNGRPETAVNNLLPIGGWSTDESGSGSFIYTDMAAKGGKMRLQLSAYAGDKTWSAPVTVAETEGLIPACDLLRLPDGGYLAVWTEIDKTVMQQTCPPSTLKYSVGRAENGSWTGTIQTLDTLSAEVASRLLLVGEGNEVFLAALQTAEGAIAEHWSAAAYRFDGTAWSDGTVLVKDQPMQDWKAAAVNGKLLVCYVTGDGELVSLDWNGTGTTTVSFEALPGSIALTADDTYAYLACRTAEGLSLYRGNGAWSKLASVKDTANVGNPALSVCDGRLVLSWTDGTETGDAATLDNEFLHDANLHTAVYDTDGGLLSADTLLKSLSSGRFRDSQALVLDDEILLMSVLDDETDRLNVYSGGALPADGRPHVSGAVSGGVLAYQIENLPAGAKLIAARYENGRMTDVQVVEAPAAAGTLNLGGSGDEYKLFLTDSGTGKPLCKAWEIA